MISNNLFENYIFPQYVGHALNANECVCLCLFVCWGGKLKKGAQGQEEAFAYACSEPVCVCYVEKQL